MATSACNVVNNGNINIGNANTININGGNVVNNGNITVDVQGTININSDSSFFQCPKGNMNLVFGDPAITTPPQINLNPVSVYMDGNLNVVIPTITVSTAISAYFNDYADAYYDICYFAEGGSQNDQPFTGRANFNSVGQGPFDICIVINPGYNGEIIFYDYTIYSPAANGVGTCAQLYPNVTTNAYCDNYPQPPPYIPPPYTPVVSPTSMPVPVVPTGPVAPVTPTIPITPTTVPTGPVAPTAPTAPTAPRAPTAPTAPRAPTAPTAPTTPAAPTSSKPNVVPSSTSLLTGSFVLLLLCFSALFI
jgi:hypothetical protein